MILTLLFTILASVLWYYSGKTRAETKYINVLMTKFRSLSDQFVGIKEEIDSIDIKYKEDSPEKAKEQFELHRKLMKIEGKMELLSEILDEHFFYGSKKN